MAATGLPSTSKFISMGGLEPSPTVLNRTDGMQWGIGGWLLGPFLQKIGLERKLKIRRRVADEIMTTFASNYSKVVSLGGALSKEAVSEYSKQSKGQKHLVSPSLKAAPSSSLFVPRSYLPEIHFLQSYRVMDRTPPRSICSNIFFRHRCRS